MNDRGQYGNTFVGKGGRGGSYGKSPYKTPHPYGRPYVGQHPPTTVYVQQPPPSSSIGKWILGSLVVGGAILWGRHQAKQVEQLYKTAGLPQQSFIGNLRADVRDTYRGLTSGFHSGYAKGQDAGEKVLTKLTARNGKGE